MSNYFENINKIQKQYFEILSKEIPDFIKPYIEIPQMKRLSGVTMYYGIYTPILKNNFYCSRLDHCVGVALITWNFTRSKEQTITALLHDIATPAFSHVIDFLHQDTIKQETSEQFTQTKIEKNMALLKLLESDAIPVEKVVDEKKYSIIDNKKPKLSAGRLEYTFTTNMIMDDYWKIEDIKEIYEDIVVLENKNEEQELGFQTKTLAEKFTKGALNAGYLYQYNEDKFVMQFLSDILKKAIQNKVILEKDLYELTETEVINRIISSHQQKLIYEWKLFCNLKQIQRAEEKPKDATYCVKVDVKKRYIDPLVKYKDKVIRISEVSKTIKTEIQKFLEYNDSEYSYIPINYQ